MTRRLIGSLMAALLVAAALTASRAEETPAEKAMAAATAMVGRLDDALDIGEMPSPAAWESAVQRLRSIVDRYPDSPQAPEALWWIGGIASNHLGREKDAIAAYERIVERYPWDAWKALDSLHCSAWNPPYRDRWPTVLPRLIAALRRGLAVETADERREPMLQSLVRAYDYAGDTEQAVACCQQMIAAGLQCPWDADFARRYIEDAQTWPMLRLAEECSVEQSTPADDLTPDVEVEQHLGRCLSVSIQAPQGKAVPCSVAFSVPAVLDVTQPAASVETSSDGRTVATWRQEHEGEGLLWYRPHEVSCEWKSKAHVEDVKVWRTVEIIRPGRELVTVFVQTERPVEVAISTNLEVSIDWRSVRPETQPGAGLPIGMSWGFERPLDCSAGRVFTFEADLRPGVKLMVPDVFVYWSRHDHPLGPKTCLAESPRITSYQGRLGEIPYALTSEMPFRVVERWAGYRASVRLSGRTQR